MLKKSQVDSAKPAKNKYLVNDTGGLYLAVYPTGKKTWVLRDTTNGKDKQKTIGSYPDMSLNEARLISENPKKIFSRTFRSWEEEWIDRRKTAQVRQVSLNSINSRMRIHVLPYMGDTPISEITADTIQGLVDKLEAQGKNSTARKCVGLIGEVLRYAHRIDRNVIDCTSDIYETMAKRNVEHFATIIQPKQIGKLMRDIENYQSIVSRLALKFVAYTFVRYKNIREAEWSEINEDMTMWRIPANKMKVNKTHLVPLPKQCKEILIAMKAMTGGRGYIFPSSRDMRSIMGSDTLLHALRRMGYGAGEMTVHGFRSMANTILMESEKDWTRYAVDLQMAHVETSSVNAAYNYAERINERTKMLQWYADYLDELKRLS